MKLPNVRINRVLTKCLSRSLRGGNDSKWDFIVAPSGGIEPPTLPLGRVCSIQLSYDGWQDIIARLQRWRFWCVSFNSGNYRRLIQDVGLFDTEEDIDDIIEYPEYCDLQRELFLASVKLMDNCLIQNDGNKVRVKRKNIELTGFVKRGNRFNFISIDRTLRAHDIHDKRSFIRLGVKRRLRLVGRGLAGCLRVGLRLGRLALLHLRLRLRRGRGRCHRWNLYIRTSPVRFRHICLQG